MAAAAAATQTFVCRLVILTNACAEVILNLEDPSTEHYIYIYIYIL